MTTGGHSGATVPRATCGGVEGLSMHEAAEITADRLGRVPEPAAPGTAARPSRHQRPGPGHRRRM